MSLSATARPDEVVGEIRKYRQKLSHSRAGLAELQAHLDNELVEASGADAAALASRVALKEREVAALVRKISSLEENELPSAEKAEADARRSFAVGGLASFHAGWLADAEALAEAGAELSTRLRAFRQREHEYAQLADLAGFAPKEINRAAIVAMFVSLVPDIINELAATYTLPVLSSMTPAEVVASQAPSRLPRGSDR